MTLYVFCCVSKKLLKRKKPFQLRHLKSLLQKKHHGMYYHKMWLHIYCVILHDTNIHTYNTCIAQIGIINFCSINCICI